MVSHPLRVVFLGLGLVTSIAGADGVERKQLRTLGKAERPRFELTDRVWPEEPGRADVCLWKDDKLCAMSFTVDDNTAPDHEWWAEQAERYDFRVTWFVITNLVDQSSYHGTWDGFSRLRERGHDIQSHTMTHLSPPRGFDPDDPQHDVDAEYGGSLRAIEDKIPDACVTTMAYPGGKNSHHNDHALAAKYYVAARGTRGTINPANQIDYMDTHSIGNGPVIHSDRARWALVENLFDPDSYRASVFRGWYCLHHHQVRAESRPKMIEAFEYLQQRRDQIWIGLFREVAMYGQERDTAQLQVTSVDDRVITMSLSDDMHDQLFDFPLTVKLRLPEGWTRVAASQAERSVAARVVEHQGGRFALVQAVPDRGAIVIQSVD